MSKRMDELKAQIDAKKLYSLSEAIALVQKTGALKFDSSVELHVRLGINPKKTDQLIRGTAMLPHGTGKIKRIAAFVSANDQAAAKEAGADLIMGEEEIKILKQTGKIDFDIAVATPDMMPKIAMVARILGPRGIMPNPKVGTVGADVKKMIGELKKGKFSFKNDDTANIHQVVGKVSFDASKLEENIDTFLEILLKAKPNGVKGNFIKAMYLTSSMGPSVKLEIPS
ncbi:MAG: 50S ribosomal protein L1 [Candidatus Magasanikbacteria bacterium]|nr:50S ribosomal protein L1 [Candidatus Magasanikbacteria bacterium]MBT4220674.1 50S ribosomal protein L1 [Candidatus Magasanikbacteria bacterium]MBT4350378.1 50S ribosomal protein L1 [Candidatus Magasanikbacteria bacterium]MBT4541828.1 50S ribosomal protein L1 [Candidatus Magasanikbacteria bacterium]MBT6252762.1 50S ribosomal protein L1 [Candidatus Magasanikbacteria bacterium]